jgi:NitT/TauT family transport system substrate-binding protein
MRSRTLLAAGAALAVLSALGCSHVKTNGNAASAAEVTDVKIMVGGIDKVIYLPAELTVRLGYFKDQGLNVSVETEPAGAVAENVLLAGDVQAVVGFYDHTVVLQPKGKCLESVVQLADVPGEVEMVATSKAGQITSPTDFKGKKLGITSPGSSTDFLTQFLAGKAGITKADYTTVTAGAGQTFIAAITNGGIDAGMTTDPTAAQLVSSGKAKVLLDMRTEQGTKDALGGLYPASSLYMQCDWVAAHKPTVQKLANALVKTLQWIHSHSPDQIAQQMPTEYAGNDPTLYVKAIGDTIGMFNTDGRMKPDGARNVLAVQSQFNPDVKGKQDGIDLAKTYTNEFVAATANG